MLGIFYRYFNYLAIACIPFFLTTALYVALQEIYLNTCTIRGGIMNLFLVVPSCSYISQSLSFLSNTLLTVMLSGALLLLSIVRER